MSLSDRLNQAKTQRLIAAGVLSSEHALKPEQTPGSSPVDDSERDVFTPITIEVAPTGLHPVAQELGQVDVDASCPNCNGPAKLDMVDLVGHTNHYTCSTCGTMWQTRLPSDETINR